MMDQMMSDRSQEITCDKYKEGHRIYDTKTFLVVEDANGSICHDSMLTFG